MSAQAETEVTQKYIVSDRAIEIDLAIAKFAIYTTKGSNYTYAPKNHFRSIKPKLIKEQHKLKHKKKFSSN